MVHDAPPNWPVVKLGEVGEWLSGGTPDKGRAEYWGGEVPWASAKDMKVFELRDTEDHITETGLNEGSQSVDAGTILIVVRGMILAHTFPVAIVSRRMGFNQDIKAIRCNVKVDARYLAHWLVSQQQQVLCKVTDTSHGTKRLDTRYLQQHAFPCPPLPEQRAIAAVLDAADAAIERTRAAVAAARRVKRGLVQALLTRGIGHTQFKPSVLGEIPQSWEVVSVGHLLTDAQYGLSMPMLAKGEYPILRMAAIQDGNVLLGDLKYVDLPKELAGQYLCQRGDILFNRTNSLEHVGKVGVFRSDLSAVFASYLIRLKTRADLVDNYFLGQMLSSYPVQCRIRRYATPGVQQVNINATNVKRVFLAFPTGSAAIAEQRRIAEILEGQDDSIRQLEHRAELLSRLKRGLMQVLLTGRVRMPMVDRKWDAVPVE